MSIASLAEGPVWSYSVPITPSDTTPNVPANAIGIHNSSDTAGGVKITYGNGKVDTIYLAAGQIVFIRDLKDALIWSSGLGAGSISALC